MATSSPHAAKVVLIGPADADKVVAAADCFDHQPRPDATQRFLNAADHHLFIAYVGDEPAGMVTGVELTHPDKGTEMFLYELGVREEFRNRGIGRALVRALAEHAAARGCYGMWVLTDDDNPAAVRAYTAAGGKLGGHPRSIDWTFQAT
ncbi:GNAT family N-acetyltransferase [Actinopolymorpha alba]|uniref:GNAT family N-acetyltransferase n=1 Tax=Actinopolymorpha alba TaxID=533267 RepID=UPI00036B6F9E|nr:GNAT family N-acetyltransferase [Actinopolymorpha alba]